MNQIRLLPAASLTAALFLTLSPRCDAETIGMDDFSYPDGAVSGRAGGFGFDWDNVNRTHTGSKSDWDAVTGSAATAEGRLITGSSGQSSAKREYNGPTSGTGTSDERSGAFQGSGAVYYRVEMTRTAASGWSVISSYDFADEKIVFGAPRTGNRFGIEVLNSGAPHDGVTFSAVTPNSNQTYALVAKLDFDNDLLSLYVDPDLFAAESKNSPVVTRPYTFTNWSTAVRLGSAGTTTWDKLVVADSWDDLGGFAPSTVVTNGDNSGPGSLRQAIASSPSGTRIVFDPGAFNGRENFIFLQSNLNVVGKSLAIDASNIAGGITLLGFANSPPSFGGCLRVNTGNVSARSITFRDGRAVTGGGVSITNGGSFTAINCVFDSNASTGRGGAVYNQATCILTSCTFTGNSSDDLGGAVHTESVGGGALTEIRHCTIVQNTSPASNGAVTLDGRNSAAATVLSSIISGNLGGNDVATLAGGSFVSAGGNLIGNGGGDFNATGDDTGVTDPMLAPLTWNGGTTQTHLPLPGSPAIDSGRRLNSSPSTDARGLPRTLDGITDVGAAEASWAYNVSGTVDNRFGYFQDITCPGDTVFPLPFGDKPAAERVPNAIDDDINTKYLNFVRLNTGLEVIPCAGRSQLVGFTLTSANDFPGRDPKTYLVIGHNPGVADKVISAGEIPAFSGRFTKQEFFFQTPSAPFDGFSIVFPSVQNVPVSASNDSMQIAEIELLGAPADPSVRILSFEVTNTAPLQKDWTMLWTSFPGRNYALEFSDDLGGWIRWAQKPSDGFTTSYSTFDPVPDHRYHRIVDLAAAAPLWIDFNSTTQDGGPHPVGGFYQDYNAGHEVSADFTTMSYNAFDRTVTVTPDWPNTTDNRVRQMIDRGTGNDNNWDNGAGDLQLVTDFLGIDSRTGGGGNGNWDGITGTPTYMTLALGNLPPGNYDWLSFHHDTENVHGPFSVEISTDGGANFTQLADGNMTDSTPLGTPDSMATEVGPDALTLSSTYTATFAANGSDAVILRFAPYAAIGVHRQIWGINGFILKLR